ncbi:MULTISPECIES: hypothetical protein [unclassified Streptomyces]|uniref:hypothetical protein n=1 Tax=unclassified Streptomyces TaxID=2593676 RepID=UPI003325DF8A
MIGVLALPAHPVAERLRLHVERSWDGLDELDVVMFKLEGLSFAISKHDGNPLGFSCIWLTQPHQSGDRALDTLLEVVGIGEDVVAFHGHPREDPPARSSRAAPSTFMWARFRRIIRVPQAAN